VRPIHEGPGVGRIVRLDPNPQLIRAVGAVGDERFGHRHENVLADRAAEAARSVGSWILLRRDRGPPEFRR
jgi:hypothetical protein